MPGSAGRVKRHHPRRSNPWPAPRRLTRQTKPGNTTMNSGDKPRNPNTYRLIAVTTTPTEHQTPKTANPPLDTNRPFMDDTGRLWRRADLPGLGRVGVRLLPAAHGSARGPPARGRTAARGDPEHAEEELKRRGFYAGDARLGARVPQGACRHPPGHRGVQGRGDSPQHGL
jgi:hypothetical protein